MKPTVYIIEPQSIFIPELFQIVIGAGARVAHFAPKLDLDEVARLRADYALLDFDYMPFSVLDGLTYFHAAAPGVRPIVMTTSTDPAAVARFRQAGAHAVLGKSMNEDDTIDALRTLFDAPAAAGAPAAPRARTPEVFRKAS